MEFLKSKFLALKAFFTKPFIITRFDVFVLFWVLVFFSLAPTTPYSHKKDCPTDKPKVEEVKK